MQMLVGPENQAILARNALQAGDKREAAKRAVGFVGAGLQVYATTEGLRQAAKGLGEPRAGSEPTMQVVKPVQQDPVPLPSPQEGGFTPVKSIQDAAPPVASVQQS